MCERTIAYRPAFLRDVKRFKNKHYDMDKLKTAIRAVAERRTDWLKQHPDHQLTGSLADYRELHIVSDWLLLYTIDNDNTLTLVRTGTHDQLL
ncbi:type II toxin-antitoxin system RelE/ParE family toxin [Cutibacterium namnetense]|uniref:Type II toxin-antitoxin system mRNA interferase toxin, RelE/StbE family n=1 Tax=Cutibacterium namnetense TaxID=1574624 RepID=A0ABX9I7G7_9ACTN|nr:type II toxin-antitoxin system YafQ family toxin [Cutibacterium namnetense]REB68300.1 type II toxin-antitoxin system mRNA interferase toxin, RelE/StbE family [Cutibacterium namnetense]